MTLKGPFERYRELLAADRLKPDTEQALGAAALDSLHREINAYRPGGGGFLRSLLRLGPKSEPPKGLYIHGSVGRGKSLLMDIFFESSAMAEKRRVHFNAFMAETHRQIHDWRKLDPRERALRPEFVKEAGDDPIAPVARRICMDSLLLCFDEFQVLDVADAMILGRLFEKLFAGGAVIVLTSNIAPGDLYLGGLNRQSFLPFIALMKERMRVLELDGARDYRLDRMAGIRIYNTPLGPEAEAAMDEAWKRTAQGAEGKAVPIDVSGRVFLVPRAANGVARFSFDALCRQPRGAADYVALTRHFHTILVDGIPGLSEDQRNEARRLTLLVDTLYDERVKLICSAAAPPAELFASGARDGWFKRTVSRLTEMPSEGYLRLDPRTPGTDARAEGTA